MTDVDQILDTVQRARQAAASAEGDPLKDTGSEIDAICDLADLVEELTGGLDQIRERGCHGDAHEMADTVLRIAAGEAAVTCHGCSRMLLADAWSCPWCGTKRD